MVPKERFQQASTSSVYLSSPPPISAFFSLIPFHLFRHPGSAPHSILHFAGSPTRLAPSTQFLPLHTHLIFSSWLPFPCSPLPKPFLSPLTTNLACFLETHFTRPLLDSVHVFRPGDIYPTHSLLLSLGCFLLSFILFLHPCQAPPFRTAALTTHYG